MDQPGTAAIDPTTFGIGNVAVTGVTIDQVQDLGNNLERYLYNTNVNTLPLGTIDVTLVGGQVADMVGNSNATSTQSFTLVSPNIQYPVANPQSTTTAQDADDAIALTGTDPNTPPLPLNYIVTTDPAHGVLLGTAPDLTYTPNPGYFGPDSFHFRVNNGSLDSADATVTIEVVGRPSAIAPSPTVAQDGSVSLTLKGTDPNTPPLPLAYTVTTDPAHGTLSGTAPDLTYTPDPGYFGADQFAYTVGNGVATSSTATVSIDIVGRPTADSPSMTVVQDTATSIVLSGTDPNGAPPAPDLHRDGQPMAHGTLSGTAPDLTYTPNPGYTGPDSFQFRVNNGTLDSDTATVSIVVASPSVTVPPTDGPRVTKVRRYGYHQMPTTLVLAFDQPLDPNNSLEVRNYIIKDPSGHRIRVRQASYDAARMTVTLHPDRQISIHYAYHLTVVGIGSRAVRGVNGRLLDGADSGQAGSDYHLRLTWRQLVFGHVSASFRARYDLLHGHRHRDAHQSSIPHGMQISPGAKRSPGFGVLSLDPGGDRNRRGG